MDSVTSPDSWVKRLEVKNFRCFSKHSLDLDKRHTIIEGHNGVGKTSLLEALYYGCYLRSFRTANAKDMIAFGAPGFFIKIELESTSVVGTIISTLQIGFADGERHVKIDNQTISSYKELMALLRVISITEADLLLVQGPPEERRSFVDYALLLENPEYAQALTALKQRVVNRNALLQKGGRAQDYAVFTQQLWDQSLVIQTFRQNYLMTLQKQVNLLIDSYFSNQCSLDIQYRYKKEMTDSAQAFMHANPALYEQECKMKRSLFGAHQDDIAFIYNAQGSRAFASRGQQKLIVLLLKMAQIQLLRLKHPSVALLFLLDDYMTDFDELRASLVIKTVQNLNVQLVFTSPIGQSKAHQMIIQSGGSIASML